MKQTTLKEGFSLKGKGLHSGLDITAEFLPAPDNHGYKFQRVDVEGEPIIDALAENVKATTRGTVIGRGDVHISTIEHSLCRRGGQLPDKSQRTRNADTRRIGQ